MYRCELTNELVGPNVPLHRVILEKRETRYERVMRHGRNKGQTETVYGWEIVKEANVSPTKYEELTGLKATLSQVTPVAKDVKVFEEERDYRRPNRRQYQERKPLNVEYVKRNDKRNSRPSR
jgi:hypothetical protein